MNTEDLKTALWDVEYYTKEHLAISDQLRDANASVNQLLEAFKGDLERSISQGLGILKEGINLVEITYSLYAVVFVRDNLIESVNILQSTTYSDLLTAIKTAYLPL